VPGTRCSRLDASQDRPPTGARARNPRLLFCKGGAVGREGATRGGTRHALLPIHRPWRTGLPGQGQAPIRQHIFMRAWGKPPLFVPGHARRYGSQERQGRSALRLRSVPPGILAKAAKGLKYNTDFRKVKRDKRSPVDGGVASISGGHARLRQKHDLRLYSIQKRCLVLHKMPRRLLRIVPVTGCLADPTETAPSDRRSGPDLLSSRAGRLHADRELAFQDEYYDATFRAAAFPGRRERRVPCFRARKHALTERRASVAPSGGWHGHPGG